MDELSAESGQKDLQRHASLNETTFVCGSISSESVEVEALKGVGDPIGNVQFSPGWDFGEIFFEVDVCEHILGENMLSSEVDDGFLFDVIEVDVEDGDELVVGVARGVFVGGVGF